MIPDRLLAILRTCTSEETSRFPPTEIFNEGWMLRLVLDAAEQLKLTNHPLEFSGGARWYSEALLLSPFRPRMRADALGEGFTNADAVVGHFEFTPSTKAGLRLRPDATQFAVIEAKMFSDLSKGTKNAPLYDQAARNVACMAHAIAQSGRPLTDFQRLGFFVIAQIREKRSNPNSNLEARMTSDSIRAAIATRVMSYEGRTEVGELREWEQSFLHPLVDRLVSEKTLAVLSWEDCIAAIAERDCEVGEQLGTFYQRCLTYRPGPQGK